MSDRWAALALGACFAALTALTWRRWGMPEIDAGAELTTADLVKHGALAYRDVRYWYGPLGLYSLALAFKLLGTSFATAYAFGLAQTAAILAVFYALARRWLEPLPAVLAGAVLLAIGFSGTAFNFVLPHTDSATFGLLFLLATLLALAHGRLLTAGTMAGLVALTRPEFALAAAAALAAYTVAGWRMGEGSAALRVTLRLGLPALALPAIVLGGFAAQVGLGTLFAENLWPAKFIHVGARTQRAWMPFTLASFAALAARAAIYVGLLAALVKSAEGWSGRAPSGGGWPGSHPSGWYLHGSPPSSPGWGARPAAVGGPWSAQLGRFGQGGAGSLAFVPAAIGALWPLATAALGLLAADGALRASGVLATQRAAIELEARHLMLGMSWLPALGLGAAALAALRLARRGPSPLGGAWPADAALIVAAAVLGLRAYNAFTTEGSYSPYYAAPLVLALAIVHARVAGRGPHARVASFGALGLVAAGLAAYALGGLYVHDATPVHTPRGTFLTSAAAAPALRGAVRRIDALSRPGERVLAAPVDGGLYFMADRPPALRELTVLPGLLASAGEEEAAVARLRRERVKLAVIGARDFSPWGTPTFGVDYAARLGSYLRGATVAREVLGTLAQPAGGTNPSKGFTVLRLR
ncbi:MAG TPA: hypothetical protein VID29_05375 [Solirubrobacteraceae bacterium]